MPRSIEERLALARADHARLLAKLAQHGTRRRPGIRYEIARLDRMIRSLEDRFARPLAGEPVVQRDG